MGALFDQLKAYFEHMGWPVNPVQGFPALSFSYQASGGTNQWVFVATVDETNGILTLFSRAPFACPPERRPAMAELIVRTNYGMTHGCFDMDWSDGEVRYRTGVDLAGLDMTWELLTATARYNLASMETYLPALRAVAEQGAAPEQVLAEVLARFDA